MGLSGTFTGLVHVYPVRVYFEDTDAGGLVYHSRYVNFAERARTEMMRLFGVRHSSLIAEEGIAFAVRRLLADYRRPARLDDTLEVHTRVLSLGGASIDVEQRILRQGDQEELVRLELRLACIDLAQARAARLPADLRERLQAFLDQERVDKGEG